MKEVTIKEFLDALADILADKVAARLKGDGCKCGPKEEPVIKEGEKEDAEFEKNVKQVEKRIEEQKPKEEEADDSCGISFEQMNSAAKNVAKQLGSSVEVKKMIAMYSRNGLKEVPKDQYPSLLEVLSSLLEDN